MLHSPGRRAAPERAAPRLDHYSHAIAPARSALERALLAALRLRRPHVLERLVAQAGAAAFARALSTLSARQMVDALSLLPSAQRAAVCAQLPALARRQWQALDRPADAPAAAAAPPVPARPAGAAAPPRAARWAWPWRPRAARAGA